MKRVILFASLGLATGLAGAPVPKPTTKERIETISGKLQDPEGKCGFQLDGTKLTVDLPGGKEYMCHLGEQNVPRLTRKVEGDFIVTVKCSAALPKDAKPAEGKWAEVGCGLYIRPKVGYVNRYGLSDFIYESEKQTKHHQVVIGPISTGPSGQHYKDSTNTIYVRFSRIGQLTEYSTSADGKKFTRIFWSTTDTGEAYELGVYACSNCTTETRAVLEDFKLELIKAEKK